MFPSDFKHHMFDLPHRRYNPLTGEWILVSPHRARRPWQGQQEPSARSDCPDYDPDCHLCPGNSRTGGIRNPDYRDTLVFDNDFPALLPDIPAGEMDTGGLLKATPEKGLCRVMCFSPRHDLSLPQMAPAEIQKVVDEWVRQFLELSKLGWINHIQIFENKEALMGASNPHPHCQIWAHESLHNEAVKEQNSLRAWLDTQGQCLLCQYLELEQSDGERLVLENDDFSVLVPYWAVWPFETLLISKRHRTGLDQLSTGERSGLAEILKRLTTRYDNLFQTPFPYSMGFHQRPTDGASHEESHLHAHFYPPLLRSATIRKFMVGFEMLGTPMRDITAEIAAARLRELPDKHYLDG